MTINSKYLIFILGQLILMGTMVSLGKTPLSFEYVIYGMIVICATCVALWLTSKRA